MAAVNIETMEPFGRLRNKVAEFYDDYLDRISGHFQWLDEILGQAEQAFNKPGVELLPKTPSEKRKRGRVKRGSVQKRESSVKKRSSARTSRKSPTLVKVKMAMLEFGEESETIANGSLSPQASEAGPTNVPLLQMDTVEENQLEKEPREVEDIPKDKDTPSSSVRLEKDSVNIESGAVEIPEVPVTLAEKTFQLGIEATENDEEETGEAVEIALPLRRSSPQQQQQGLVVPNDEITSVEPRTPEPTVQTARTAFPAMLQPPSKLPVSASGKKGKHLPLFGTPRLTPTATREAATTASGGLTRSEMLLKFRTAASKREDLLKQKIEEQKRKREERALKVAQQRLQHNAQIEELKRKIEQKYQKSATFGTAEHSGKVRHCSPSPFGSAKPKDFRPKLQHENIKEKVKEQKEYEESRRLAAQEKEQLKQSAACSSSSVVKQAHGKIQHHNDTMGTVTKKPTKPTSSVIRPGSALVNSTGDIESYDITPLRELKPSTATNYDISDLRSSDETDDEDNPRKKIPTWAQGGQLKCALTHQFYYPPDLDELFGVVDMPDLSKMFTIQRKRFYKRTSSAKWDSPIRPHQDS